MPQLLPYATRLSAFFSTVLDCVLFEIRRRESENNIAVYRSIDVQYFYEMAFWDEKYYAEFLRKIKEKTIYGYNLYQAII